jgi:ribonuclease H / adenosylcobalamin/alpha-ribazole phosphatase
MLCINTDGGSRGNPGSAGIGVIAKKDGATVFTLAEFIGTQTNNFAEYIAVIRALETCIEKKTTHEALAFFLDVPLVARVRELAKHFPSVTYAYVPRAQNAEADALANEAMDAGESARRI